MKLHRVYTAEAVVLKRRNVGEGDRLLTVFTRHLGKMTVLARGVRKINSKRAPHVEIFNHVILTIHRGTMNTLTEVEPIAIHENIRKSLKRVGAAYYLSELIDGLLPQEQANEEAFALLLTAFDTLTTVEETRVDVLRERFALALLRQLGFLETAPRDKNFSVDAFVEGLLERRLKTSKFAATLT